MKNITSQSSNKATQRALRNSLLALWLLTLPASGFAPLFYSSGQPAPSAERTPEGSVSESTVQGAPASSNSSNTGAAPKSQVNFWLIAGASSGVNFSSTDNNKRQRDRTGFCYSANYQKICSNIELGQCNRRAILKSAEFTLLGLKPSGVS